jgi:hypothetical protein
MSIHIRIDRRYIQIDERTCAAGRDWTSLIGSTLCNACYVRFKERGTLERKRNTPLPPGSKSCSYEACMRPKHSRRFVQVGAKTTAGGKDWGALVGKVLCDACYTRFKDTGSLGRLRPQYLGREPKGGEGVLRRGKQLLGGTVGQRGAARAGEEVGAERCNGGGRDGAGAEVRAQDDVGLDDRVGRGVSGAGKGPDRSRGGVKVPCRSEGVEANLGEGRLGANPRKRSKVEA